MLDMWDELKVRLLSPTFSATSRVCRTRQKSKGQLMRVEFSRGLVFVAAAVLAICSLANDAVAGITISVPQTSTASYEVRGHGSFPANEIHLKPPTTTGTTSALASTDFDSGDGFKGHVEASTSTTTTVGYNSLLLISVTSTT